jgi:hypothetical protein
MARHPKMALSSDRASVNVIYGKHGTKIAY